MGAGEIVLTSMDADGTQNGYDIPMTRAVAEAVRSRLSPAVVPGQPRTSLRGGDLVVEASARIGGKHLSLRDLHDCRDQAVSGRTGGSR